MVQKSESYGIVAEVKKSFPRDQELWKADVAQIRGYDVPGGLVGWWTDGERMPTSNVVALIHLTRARRFLDHVGAPDSDSGWLLGPTTAVVEFVRSDEAKTFVTFRTVAGHLFDDDIRKKLHEGCAVPWEPLVRVCSNLEYYDAPPPTELLLERLWTDYFPSALGVPFHRLKEKFVRLVVRVDEITAELQRLGSARHHRDSRSVEFPAAKWVRAALDELVRIRFAESTGTQGEYVVFYRALKGDVLRKFFDLLSRRQDSDGDSDDDDSESGLDSHSGSRQLGLFPDRSSDPTKT